MGGGYHGGFGNTLGSIENGKILLPRHDSQLMHIFRKDVGHLTDTPENRKKLIELANDPEKYVNTDKRGNKWHSEMTEEGSQYWVCHRDGIIRNGGLNLTPKSWIDLTGFCRASRMVKNARMKRGN